MLKILCMWIREKAKWGRGAEQKIEVTGIGKGAGITSVF